MNGRDGTGAEKRQGDNMFDAHERTTTTTRDKWNEDGDALRTSNDDTATATTDVHISEDLPPMATPAANRAVKKPSPLTIQRACQGRPKSLQGVEE